MDSQVEDIGSYGYQSFEQPDLTDFNLDNMNYSFALEPDDDLMIVLIFFIFSMHRYKVSLGFK